MPILPTPLPTDPTLDAIHAAMEAANKAERPRPYLGMSGIGEDCERRLWYGFRWCLPPGAGFDAKGLSNVQDGHRSEDVMAARLRMVKGVELFTVDPTTQRQFGFSDIAGHFRGHADGFVRGLLQAPKTWHVWEHKASEKGPAELAKHKTQDEKTALEKWNSTYYAQAVLYMHYGEMSRHYLTCSSPGARLPVTSVRTDASPQAAQRLIEKATRIIYAPDPLPRLSDDAAFYKCKFCPAAKICHTAVLPSVSCRTCVHASPAKEGDGAWTCALNPDAGEIPADFQHTGCERHLYIPALLSRWGEAVDASDADNWIEYRAPDGFVFRNGPWDVGSYTSKELSGWTPALLRDPQFAHLREKYAARFLSESEWEVAA